MPMWTNLEIQHTFRQAMTAGYVAENAGGFISCPPYVIASTAVRPELRKLITLPEGYSEATLRIVMDLTGFVGCEVTVSDGQANELAEIGEQLLQLNSAGKIDPGLDIFREQSIRHLVTLVKKVAGQQH